MSTFVKIVFSVKRLSSFLAPKHQIRKVWFLNLNVFHHSIQRVIELGVHSQKLLEEFFKVHISLTAYEIQFQCETKFYSFSEGGVEVDFCVYCLRHREKKNLMQNLMEY